MGDKEAITEPSIGGKGIWDLKKIWNENTTDAGDGSYRLQ